MKDKDKIKSEIERLLNKEWKWGSSIEAKFRCEAYRELLDFIDSLPKEPTSSDLEEAADNFCENIKDKCHMLPDMKIIAFHTFKAGASWQKQQMMMKDAIDAKIVPANLGETEFCTDCYDEVECVTKLVRENNLKIGDKVKLLVIKED